MLRPVFQRVKWPVLRGHPCRRLSRPWTMFKLWSKNGDTKNNVGLYFWKIWRKLVCIWSVFLEKVVCIWSVIQTFSLQTCCVITALVPNNSGLGFLVGHVRWKFLLWVTGFPIFWCLMNTNVVTYGELMVFWSWLMEGFRLILWLCAFSRLAAVLGSLVEAVVWGVFFIFPISLCNKVHPADVPPHHVS